MEVSEQYNLINEKHWTEFLKSLEVGNPQTYTFPSLKLLRSCKTVAYEINGNKTGRKYSFSVNKAKKMATITVTLL